MFSMQVGIQVAVLPSFPPLAEYRNSMQGYLDGIQAAVPRILEEPSANVVMDGSMSTFALYWAGSGVSRGASRSLSRRGQHVNVHPVHTGQVLVCGVHLALCRGARLTLSRVICFLSHLRDTWLIDST